MKQLETLLANAARSDRKIVLSEGADPRVIDAAIAARADDVARIVLIGNVAAITDLLAQAGSDNLSGVYRKHPCTNITALLDKNTRSGRLGNPAPCSLKRNSQRCSALRTIISGRVLGNVDCSFRPIADLRSSV